MLLGSFFMTLLVIDTYNDLSITEEVRRGAELQIKIHPRACEAKIVGVLRCDSVYRARYKASANMWEVTGKLQSAVAPELQKDGTASYANAPNEPGNISIWGLIAKFDRSGNLTIGAMEGAGSVQIDRLKRLFHRLTGYILS